MDNEQMNGLEEDVRTGLYRRRGATCRDAGRFMSVVPEAERFWSKVEVTSGCWLWCRGLNQFGYGLFRRSEGSMVLAHRFAYEQVRGPIPAGLTLDHLCETPACVKPSHLEPVTNSENLRRRHARVRLRKEQSDGNA